MTQIPLKRRFACESAIDVCCAVIDAVANVPLHHRARRVPSLLKPPPEVSALPDAAGERAALEALGAYAAAAGVEVRLLTDPVAGTFVVVPPTAVDGPGSSKPPAASSSSSSSSSTGNPGQRAVYVYADAVDGTLLLSGLANELNTRSTVDTTAPILRLAGAGGWAVGVALTDPTGCPPEALTVGEFTVAAVADGTALAAGCSCCSCGGGGFGTLPLHPSLACAVWEEEEEQGEQPPPQQQQQQQQQQRRGRYITFDCSAARCRHRGNTAAGPDSSKPAPPQLAAAPPSPRLFTSSCSRLGSTFAYLDAFQARDAATASPGDADLAVRLFGALGDRTGGGAFDVVRSYGNLGALLRSFFGWRFDAPSTSGNCGSNDSGKAAAVTGTSSSSSSSGSNTGLPAAVAAAAAGASGLWLEPQAGVLLAINENLANLLPAVPLVLGAGGVATDFRGRPLAARRLAEGRCSVVYAGNAGLHCAVMAMVGRCGGGGDGE